ncbi:MAG TPA: CVNH domain-containing protein [Dongiaceae bacterium]|nr:CVNH domain-containing protein [Dongiaceae bacterium]
MGQPPFRPLAAVLGAFLALVGLRATTAAAAAPPPYGSYLQSCRDVRVQNLPGGSGATIVARCRSIDGRYVTSTLPVDCDGDIANVNGQLRCVASAPSNRPPYGSYQQSCNGAYMTGPILHATCFDRKGRPVQAALNVLGCKGDIANLNGQLGCVGTANRPPAGSYQQSCGNAYMSGPILNASCRDSSGRYRQTALNVLGCRDDIANINGNLACRGRGWGPITIYAGTNWQGASRAIQYATPDLAAIGFNNSARSVAIAQGNWEFCTAPYYGGRCVRLDRGSADLARIGMANQISSIRPVP